MKTEISTGVVCINFTHNPPPDDPTVRNTTGIPYGTVCTLNREYYKGEELYRGNSYLSQSDFGSYCKETGRKIALKRAISDLGRDDRKKLWETYLNR